MRQILLRICASDAHVHKVRSASVLDSKQYLPHILKAYTYRITEYLRIINKELHEKFMNLTAISIVIPCHNEAGNMTSLVQEILFSLGKDVPFEIILVDDGSTDSTYDEIHQCVRAYPAVTAIRHDRCYGQSTALRTGIRLAQYDWIVTMDGDGQNNPVDIPLLLNTLQKYIHIHGAQSKVVVFGNRYGRRDSWIRRLASRCANGIRQLLLGDTCIDTGCSLKLFPRQGFLDLPLFDHFHRFLPVLFQGNGYHILNILVGHRPRIHGRSKYTTLRRALEGLVDLFGVLWLKHRGTLGNIETIDTHDAKIQSHQQVG